MRENLVRHHRQRRDWSQAELAGRAGISRAAVSAIESQRIVPSVAVALQLANAFACTVEELFGAFSTPEIVWARPIPQDPCRFWHAEVDGRIIHYPVESTPCGHVPHNGVYQGGNCRLTSDLPARQTLVIACCDPAASLLATELRRRTEFRLLVLTRSSRQAMAMLQNGTAHIAGLHLATAKQPENNTHVATEMLGNDLTFLKGADWTEGLALNPNLGGSVDAILDSDLTWIGREPGSGAQQCFEEIFSGRESPSMIARDHRGVVDAVRCGWGDVGICLQLPAEEAGLRFLPLRNESYELCIPNRYLSNPRVQSFIKVVQSESYRKQLAELPGYNTHSTGMLTRIGN